MKHHGIFIIRYSSVFYKYGAANACSPCRMTNGSLPALLHD